MIDRLRKLQEEKGQFSKASGPQYKTNITALNEAIKANAPLKHEIEVLSKAYLKRDVKGCSNCYSDAYFELINLDITKAMEKEKSKFKLRAGALLRSPDGDVSKNVSQANLTDELAVSYLKSNPRLIKFFDKYPDMDELTEILGDGWDNNLKVQESPIPAVSESDLQAKVSELEALLSESDTAFNEVKNENADLQAKVSELEAEIEQLKKPKLKK